MIYKYIYKYIHIIWLSVILVSLLLSPKILLISISYLLAPFFILLSIVMPELTIFTGTKIDSNGWEIILVIFVGFSSIILSCKLILLIYRVIKR